MPSVAEIAWTNGPEDAGSEEHSADYDVLCNEAKVAWARHFPARRGYVLLTLPVPGDATGVRLSALRGDFRADLDVVYANDDHAQGPEIRVSSTVNSIQLFQAEQRAVAWSRALVSARGWLAPSMFFLGVGCLLAAGTWTHLVAAGVLSLCIATFLCFAGMLREHVGCQLRSRAWSSILTDIGIQRDLRRWRAFARVLARRRRALAGKQRHVPFRRPYLPRPSSAITG